MLREGTGGGRWVVWLGELLLGNFQDFFQFLLLEGLGGEEFVHFEEGCGGLIGFLEVRGLLFRDWVQGG